MPLAGRVLVDPPVLPPVRFGLFSVAEVRQVNAGMGITFDNLIGCGAGGVAIQPCETQTSLADVGLLEPEWPEGDPWTALVQMTCQGPNYFNEAKDTVTKALVANEERMVEGALMTELLAAATDKTPGGAALPAQHGIALLEGLWGQYGGAFAPTFHMDRTVAHLGWGALDRHGNHLETELGSPVAAGAGYFEPAYDEATGQAWIVASGPVLVTSGTAQALDPVFVGGTMNTDNTWIALGQRTFSWAYPCTPLKVKVNSLTDAGGL